MSDLNDLSIREMPSGAGTICEKILGALPSWFGIATSVSNYVDRCERNPTLVASLGNRDVGFLNLQIHTRYAAEIWVMAVLPQVHRRGIGKALLARAEHSLALNGIEYLQVKTLSGSKPDVGYDRTRSFYLACGFRPLEEIPILWGVDNPALQMVKSISTVP